MRSSPARVLLVAMLAALAVSAGPQRLEAQNTGQILGRVVAEGTERPLAGAQVIIPDLNLGALSGADGRFAISAVPAGTHTVRAELIGFASEPQTVTVPAGASATAIFRCAGSHLVLWAVWNLLRRVERGRRRLGAPQVAQRRAPRTHQ